MMINHEKIVKLYDYSFSLHGYEKEIAAHSSIDSFKIHLCSQPKQALSKQTCRSLAPSFPFCELSVKDVTDTEDSIEPIQQAPPIPWLDVLLILEHLAEGVLVFAVPNPQNATNSTQPMANCQLLSGY